jgi:hypothetical protein
MMTGAGELESHVALGRFLRVDGGQVLGGAWPPRR